MPPPAAENTFPQAPRLQADQAAPREILVVGMPESCLLPDPWPRLLEESRVALAGARDLFEAAAMVKQAGRRWVAMLLNPDGLTRNELKMLATVKRHVVLPIGLLPTRKRHASVSQPGILPWEDIALALGQILLDGYTPQNLEGSSRKHDSSVNLPTGAPLPPTERSIPPVSRPHNPRSAAPEKGAEIPVASKLVDRYDAQIDMPLLTENEIRALLGPMDQGSGE